MSQQQTLKQKTVRGLVWSAIERLSGQVISFALALILARLVTPEDYGVLAIVMVFVTVAGLMVDAGFANALIRKTDCTDVDRSTVFYFNLVVSALMYAIIYFAAPFLASFYENSELTPLIRCASVVVMINSLCIVQQATLTSRIDFKKQTVISLTSSIVSGLLGIALAYQGYGVWALVAQTITQYSMCALMLWIVVRWRPLLVFSRESFNDLFGYSYKLMLSNFIVRGGGEFLQLLMGRFFGAINLGYYNYANRLSNFISGNIAITVQRVLFPAFSQMQDNEEQLATNFRKSLVLSMVIIFPLMFAFSTLAEPIIKILLTEAWYPTIPLLRVIAITLAMWPLLFFNMNILWVKKRSDLSLRLEMINIVFRLGIVLVLFKSGVLWVCIALCIAEFLNFLVYSKVIEKVCTYGLFKQLKDLAYIVFSSSVSCCISYYFVVTQIENNILSIITGGISIIFIYLILIFIRKGYEYDLVLNIFKSKK